MGVGAAMIGLRPVVDRRYGLGEAVDAFREMGTARHFGKIVLEH